MNKLMIITLCAVTICLNACATPPTAKMTLRITDAETAEPLNMVKVKTQFRPDSNKRLMTETIHSDTNGMCIVEGPIDYVSIACGLESKGYYRHTAQLNFTGRSRVFNRWEPWNPTVEVEMRRKKNQHSMIYKKIFRLPPPEVDRAVGFDLQKGDWVAPHGKGVHSDFLFTVSLSETPKKGAEYVLSFNGETDGIQEYLPSEEYVASEFKWFYEAPLDGYEQGLSRFAYYMFPNPELPNSNLKDPINYIFRVRSQELKDGSVGGCYGMIKGEIQIEKENALYFEYWFNPVPNERSLEWNGVNLLKK